MLGDAIGDLLPSALAVALSPIPIVAVEIVLGASHARTAGPAFALGWIAGLAAVLGVALSGANPKNLALTLAAAASIAEAGLTAADTAIAVAAYVAIGSTSVAGAVLFYLAAPATAARPLAAVKQFTSDNNAVIMMVVLLLLGDGLSDIWD